MVHYVAYGTPGGEYAAGAHRAAVVTQVIIQNSGGAPELVVPGDVGLCVMNPTGLFFHEQVAYSEQPKPGTWHWIEKA